MNKKTIIAITVILTLSITVIVTYNLNRKSYEANKVILANAEIVLKDGNNEILLNMVNIKLSGEESFDAVLDTSASDAKNYSYVGVQLKNLLKDNNIDLNSKTTVLISGVDGYSVAYSKEEILKENNVYIAYMEDGKYLGSRDNGGTGPYESIVVSDIFSNRRCKWITKIEVK